MYNENETENLVVIDERYRDYVDTKTEYYLPHFTKMEEKGRKIFFNWAAFVFPWYWLAYRKMYVEGFVGLIVTNALTFLQKLFLSFAFVQVIQENGIDSEVGILGTFYSNQQLYATAWGSLSILMAIINIIFILAACFGLGLFGDAYYKKKIDKHFAVEATMSEEQASKYRSEKAGTSKVAVIIIVVLAFILNALTR